MLRLPLSLLLVSIVLAIDQSTDDRYNRRDNMKPDTELTYHVRQRRILQPHVEIREDSIRRYFPRRPQTTTVSSIFSMKVENESQHVYPNLSQLDNLQGQSKQKEINVTDISTPVQQQNFPSSGNYNNRRANNIRKRVRYTRTRRPNFTQTAEVSDRDSKEQEKIVLPTSDSNLSNDVSSLETLHQNISPIREASIQRMNETTEQGVNSISNTSVVMSTTENEPGKPVFTPSAAYISKLILDNFRAQPKQEAINMTEISTPTQQQSFPSTTNYNNRRRHNIRKRIRYTKSRDLSSDKTPVLVNQQTEKINEQVVASTTTAPIFETTVKEQEQFVLPTSDTKLTNDVSSLERSHPTSFQIPETFIQKMKGTTEEVFTSTSSAPILISSNEKDSEKLVYTPSDTFVSNLMLDNLTVQSKQEEINMTDISTPYQQENYPSAANFNNRRPKNMRKTIRYTRIRRPSSTQAPVQINQLTEKITERTVASTTTAPFFETTVKEQEKVVLPTSDSKLDLIDSNEVSSLETLHPTISQIPEAYIQKNKETAEKEPAVITTVTEKEPEKHVFTPSAEYISSLISFVRRRRPTFGVKSALPAMLPKEASEEAINSSTIATIAETPQRKIAVFPTTSYVSDKVSTIRPKSRRPHKTNRGSYKYNLNNKEKDQSHVPESVLDSNSSQLTSTIASTPSPVPTLSPWYDGFGK